MDVLRTKAETTGFFTRSDALRVGHDDQSIRRAIRLGVWRRVRAGAYTFPELWPAEPLVQHLIRSHAVLTKLGDRAALSHTSAAAEHGLLLWEPDVRLVHVTRTDGGAGRTEAGVLHHEGLTMPSDLVIHDGWSVMCPVRAALETASLCSTEAALVVLDSLLHQGLADRATLVTCYAGMQSWPHLRSVRIAVALADGRAESVGESRARYLFYSHGLPAPELQYKVFDRWGRLVGRTDFAWPEHRLLGEFDGKVKYEQLLREGERPSDVVVREKKREELLCRLTGFGMVRLDWADLYDARATAARISQRLRAAA